MEKFKKGDVVVLKSGSPLMTIQDFGDYSKSASGIANGAFCIWFDGPKKTMIYLM
jgi:uncharacterized protein YodC (DUF2158 family)